MTESKEQLKPLFFASHADLCELASTTDLTEAQSGKEQALQIAAAALKASEAANAKLTTMHRGAGLLSDRVGELRRLDTAEFTAYAERAVTDEAIDHEEEADSAGKRKQLLASLSGGLEFYHAAILPRENLATLVSTAALFQAYAVLSSYMALEHGIVRYNASKELLEKDGSVAYGEHGVAFEAWTNQVQAHRKAAEAQGHVETEQNRQRLAAAGRL